MPGSSVVPAIMSQPSRQRIDVKKAFVLRYINGLTESEVSRSMKVTRQSVSYALKPFRDVIEKNQAGQAYRENKPLILDAVEMDLVGLLADKGKRKKATLGNVAYALDKVNNINRLERGLSTVNVNNYDLTAEERDKLRHLEAMLIPQDVVVEGDPEVEVIEEPLQVVD
jgi:hypothetical protein